MRFALAVFGILLLSTTAPSTTIYVPDSYATIQGAIDASANGDTIIVRPGTYVENIDFIGKAVLLRSENGALCTTIDGGYPLNPDYGSTVSIKSGEGNYSILDGFTIMNGTGTQCAAGVRGGGIFCQNSSPTISNNIIEYNNCTLGAGIGCLDASPTVKNNIVRYNFADHGGGLYVDHGIANIVTVLTNNIIINNDADDTGGGIFYYGGYDYFEMINCTLCNNSAGESGGGIKFSWSRGTIDNSIFWNNSAPLEGPEIWIGGSFPTTMTIDYSDVKGGQNSVYVCPGGTLNWGTGMIEADPFFVDPVDYDFHLTWDSPCRDKGDNSAVSETTDIEGDPRIALGTVDMGADEYYYHLYHQGVVAPGSPIDIKVVGFPAVPVKLYLGSGLADPPYSTQHGNFYLNWPPLWQGNIGTVPGNGVLVFPATVPSSWTPGSEHPLQTLVGPWNGPWTWLTNAEVLVVE